MTVGQLLAQDGVAAEYPRPLVGRILQGFAPRRILRLDPR